MGVVQTPPARPHPFCQVMAAAVQVHQDVTKCGQRITRHLEAWRRWSEIWKSDKAALLDKFKADARLARAKGKTIEIKDWRPRGRTLTEQEKAWLQTRRTVTVMHFASYFL